MTPKRIKRRGKEVWIIRWTEGKKADGKARRRSVQSDSKQACIDEYRRVWLKVQDVEFTDQDRLAKQELGSRGTMLEAVRFYIAHKHAGKKRTLSGAAEAWLAELTLQGVSAPYISNAKFVLKQLKTYAGADTQVSAILTDNIKDFLNAQQWAARTRNSIRSRLTTFFNWCIADGCCSVHPIIGKVKTFKEPRTAPEIFTVEQAHRLLDTAQTLYPALLPYLVLGLFCGIRPQGEMGKIGELNINLTEGFVEVPASKGDRRTVELPENAIAWLKVAPSLTVRMGRTMRRNLRKAIGVNWKADIMRHSFASYHVKHHGNPGTTALMMGHEQSVKMLYKHYVRHVTKEEAAAFWKIEPAVMPAPALKVITGGLSTGTEG